MNVLANPDAASSAPKPAEHFDVADRRRRHFRHRQRLSSDPQMPDTSFVILETQESFGGTWLTHRYPGIRSDSDLHTFGYRFKPWVGRRSRPRRRSSPTWAR